MAEHENLRADRVVLRAVPTTVHPQATNRDAAMTIWDSIRELAAKCVSGIALDRILQFQELFPNTFRAIASQVHPRFARVTCGNSHGQYKL